jgi:HAD superfamily phosphatase (TIGR01672 family)
MTRTHASRRPALALALVLSLACASRAPAPAGESPPPAATPEPRLLTFAQLERSLASRAPCTVVFDIDDTTLFTAGAFHFALGYFEERDHGAPREDPAFWTLINDSLDQRFSRPKEVARRLIAFHRSRGDTIVFVTARFPSTPASETTSVLLMRLFGFAGPPKVIFTAQAPKTAAIRQVRPALSYGDSDGDIRDTHEADPAIRAIRILRSQYSYNLVLPVPGKFGEEVLAGSAD